MAGHASSHDIPIIHDESVAHLHVDSDGSASVAAHRHCKVDHDGDGTIDGTCPGPDLAHAPDLAWHPLLPGPSDNWWKNTAKEGIVGGSVGLLGGAIVGAAVGNVAGLVAGFVLSFLGGSVTAWLHSKDDKVTLVINGSSGCLLDLWQKKSHTVEEMFETGGYETKLNHEIEYCEKNES